MIINKKSFNTLSILLHFLVIFAIVSAGFFVNIKQIQADNCTQDQEGLCVNNKICVCQAPDACFNTGADCGSSQIGGIEPPTSILKYNDEAWRGGRGIGIVVFLSNLVQVFVIVAGIIAMFNFALAGYIFITSGSDPAAVGKVREKLTWTVIGLVFIVAAYTAAGLIGLLFFGNAGFILKPALTSVFDVI